MKHENKLLLFDSARYFCVFLCVIYTHTRSKIIKYSFRCAVALWKSWVCKYSIRFQVKKFKRLCETLKNEKWKILAWYPNKMQQYRQQSPKCGNWCWANFQMQMAIYRCTLSYFLLVFINSIKVDSVKYLLYMFRPPL